MFKLRNRNKKREEDETMDEATEARNLKFKAWLVEHDIKQSEIADLLGIDISNANQKINGKQEFTFAQVKTICAAYGLPADIFLP